jgi:coenzyme F420-0:L-glutamate ligase/coenzyme F420-1:gamma-L-glutamate ligase
MIVTPVPGLPLVAPGDDLAALVRDGLDRAGLALQDGDILAVTSKLASRSEGRFVDLSAVQPGAEAVALAAKLGKEPALVELVLRESQAISRAAPGVLIVRGRLGVVSANAGIDRSNALPPNAPAGSGPWALLLPADPDATARALHTALCPANARLGVVLTDSLGRPFRLGTVGHALGVAGMPALWDQRGRADLHGRVLEHTVTAFADQVAAAADLVAGQADEGAGVVLVRGVRWPPGPQGCAADLQRAPAGDLYA